jgi:hypothetical protein
MDHNQEQRRRGHFRGRRGPDRRGPERRSQPHQAPPRDQVDVEQIMRDIRARIAQRQGVDFSTQQIQDLAARKLESILDPRAIKPSLLEALRRGAGSTGQATPAKASSEPIYTFEDTTIYDSHRGLMRFIRRLLNPLLKLFFNPNPLIRALHLQAKLNVESATREAERERRQNEWNALHYEVVQRLVTEMSRLSLDAQSLTMRVEALNARVDFNDRRVRSMEGIAAPARTPLPRPVERPVEPAAAFVPTASNEPGTAPEPAAPAPEGSTDTARRRRRRRRGRRGTFGAPEGTASAPVQPSNRDEQDAASEPTVEEEGIVTAAEPSASAPVEAPPAEFHATDIRPADSPPAAPLRSDSEGEPTD